MLLLFVTILISSISLQECYPTSQTLVLISSKGEIYHYDDAEQTLKYSENLRTLVNLNNTEPFSIQSADVSQLGDFYILEANSTSQRFYLHVISFDYVWRKMESYTFVGLLPDEEMLAISFTDTSNELHGKNIHVINTKSSFEREKRDLVSQKDTSSTRGLHCHFGSSQDSRGVTRHCTYRRYEMESRSSPYIHLW